jgi:hypothetical protein
MSIWCFDSELALELIPKVVILTPRTPCISWRLRKDDRSYLPSSVASYPKRQRSSDQCKTHAPLWNRSGFSLDWRSIFQTSPSTWRRLFKGSSKKVSPICLYEITPLARPLGVFQSACGDYRWMFHFWRRAEDGKPFREGPSLGIVVHIVRS